MWTETITLQITVLRDKRPVRTLSLVPNIVESNNGVSCSAVLVRMLGSTLAMHYKLHVNNKISIYTMSDACTWAQQCRGCCPNARNIVKSRCKDHNTRKMGIVGSKFDVFHILPNNTQQGVETLPTCWAKQSCWPIMQHLNGPHSRIDVTVENDHWLKASNILRDKIYWPGMIKSVW